MKRAWAAFAVVVLASSVQGDEWLERPVDDKTFETFLEFFAIDDALPFETESHSVQETEGIVREHVSFQSTPGERVTAFYYQPHGASPSSATLIFLHGGGPRGKDGRHYVVMGERLTRAGWNVLMIDAKHYGERQTGLFEVFTEREIHAKLYNQPAVYLAWVTQYVKDVQRAFDFLVNEEGCRPERDRAFREKSRRRRGNDCRGGRAEARRRLAVLRRTFRRARDGPSRSRLSCELHWSYRSPTTLYHQLRQRWGLRRGAFRAPAAPLDQRFDRAPNALDPRRT